MDVHNDDLLKCNGGLESKPQDGFLSVDIL